MMRSRFKIVTLLMIFFVTGSVQASDVFRFIFLPNELLANKFSADEKLYLAGFVSSIEREEGAGMSLDVTDGHATIKVKYVGVLPDLINEGAPAMFSGTLHSNTFTTTEILLISPETCEEYLPPKAQAELVSLGFYECASAGS